MSLLIRLFSAQELIVLENTETKKPVDDILFDKTAENQKFFEATKPVYEDILQSEGNEILAMLGMDFDFNLLDPMVTNWVAEKEFKFADTVNSTTQRQLRAALVDGIREGENIESLRKRVQGVFDGTVRTTAHRSRMIARTEVIGSFNYSSLQSYKQSGVVDDKKWFTALDERVRDSHQQAHGQIRRVDEPFDIGGYPLMYPGDGDGGTASEVINCRCTILPILGE